MSEPRTLPSFFRRVGMVPRGELLYAPNWCFAIRDAHSSSRACFSFAALQARLVDAHVLLAEVARP